MPRSLSCSDKPRWIGLPAPVRERLRGSWSRSRVFPSILFHREFPQSSFRQSTDLLSKFFGLEITIVSESSLDVVVRRKSLLNSRAHYVCEVQCCATHILNSELRTPILSIGR